MKYSQLGKSGLKVSQICLGMMTYGDPSWREWTLGQEEASAHIKRVLDAWHQLF